jgi:hypothetical protein
MGDYRLKWLLSKLKTSYSIDISIPFSSGDLGSQRKRYMEASSGNLLKLRKLPSKYPFRTQGEVPLMFLAPHFDNTIHSRLLSKTY